MKFFYMLLFVIVSIGALSCTKQDIAANKIYGVLEVNVNSLDPALASDTYSGRVVSQIYEGLYHYHYLQRPLTIEPLLAAELPQVSPDGLTYTIKIKPGVRFADDACFPGGRGREIKAQDFIYSLMRIADPAVASTGFWTIDGRIKGLNEWRKAKSSGSASYATAVAGLRAVDDYTLQITLTKPYFQFVHILTMTYTKVVAKEAVDSYGKDFGSNPVGTGPYRLKEWSRGAFIRLARNPHYHEVHYPSVGEPGDQEAGLLADAGKRLPLNDEVEIKIMVERQPMWLNLIKGDIDYTMVPKDNFASAFVNGELKEEFKKLGLRNQAYANSDITYLAFNMEDPLFRNNKKLREAMIMAFDLQTSLEKFFDNRGIIANGVIPPDIDGFDPNFKSPYQFDRQLAKKRLAEAGYPDGKGLPELTFDIASTATIGRQMEEYFQNQMQQIGIKIKLIPNTWPQFDKKVKAKKSQLFVQAWSADYPDGENFLQLFYSKNISPGSNATNYQNHDYDALYEKAAALPPGPERTQLYQLMNAFIVNEAVAHFRIHRIAYRTYQGWLLNYKDHNTIHDIYKYLRIDGELKTKLKAKM